MYVGQWSNDVRAGRGKYYVAAGGQRIGEGERYGSVQVPPAGGTVSVTR